MLALLRDTGLSTVQTEYVEKARSSGQALVSLINDVLDFSKVRSETLNPKLGG